ncbi:LysR family transcriptional regulator [Zoogloea sp.]|uniref:LysR family transcriptional regulator n=1 Tax=Zoogloea sp. TaxID=49181 RepID=UPI00260F8740|nr:LysR family transcriptional regulator [Zoogloea sp.]MDD3352791.1 LysR substrate-binding domain-containing protein [Zoogloea sp.]
MPRRQITLRQLETFSTVARLGSFTRAAEALHLTQPAVSIQMRQLSGNVGMALFDTSGRELHLTAAGEALLGTVRALDDVWNRFESSIDALKGLRRGKLRVAMVTTAKYFVPRMLGAFCRRYPEISIELQIANRDRIVERLRNNEDDLYVMSYPPEDADIVVHPFLDNELVVLAPKDHWAVNKRLTLAALAEEPFLLREAGSGGRRAIDEFARELGVSLKVRLALASNEALLELAGTGMGLTVVSRHVVGERLATEGLTELSVEGFPLNRPWKVVYLKNKALSVPALAFLEELAMTRQTTGQGPA